MIYDSWFGVVNKKTHELEFMEETHGDAEYSARMIESVGNKLPLIPIAHSVVPVTVIAMPLMELAIFILDQAKILADKRQVEAIAAQARAFKKKVQEEMENGTETS